MSLEEAEQCILLHLVVHQLETGYRLVQPHPLAHAHKDPLLSVLVNSLAQSFECQFVATSMNVVWLLCLHVCIFEVKPVDSTHSWEGSFNGDQ